MEKRSTPNKAAIYVLVIILIAAAAAVLIATSLFSQRHTAKAMPRR